GGAAAGARAGARAARAGPPAASGGQAGPGGGGAERPGRPRLPQQPPRPAARTAAGPRPLTGATQTMAEHDLALNLVWVLLAAFLVMFMQVGFAMVETGFTRAKNAVNTMAMNLFIYPIGVLGFWLVGYGLLAGGHPGWPSLGSPFAGAHELGIHAGDRLYGLFGAARFALLSGSHDPANLAMFMFAAVFMDTAATIPTGAMAERWKFASFVAYAMFMSMVLYPLYGNWVWGGGWLAAMGVNWGLGHGHVDFAGSSVVHMTGGVTALAGAIVLGPRTGKFRRDGTVGPIPG